MNPMRESGVTGQLNEITDQRMFYPEFQPVFRRGCLLAQGRPKFRDLGEGGREVCPEFDQQAFCSD